MKHLKGFIGETIVYGFANVFSRVFAMLLIPLYVGILSKNEYSNLVMLQSFFVIMSFALMLTSGVFYYYYEYERIKYRKIIFTSWFYYQLTAASILIGLTVFFIPQISSVFIETAHNSEQLYYAILAVGLQFLPYIVNSTNINLYRIDRKPGMVLVIVFLEALFTLLIVAGGLTYYDFNIVGILMSQFVSRTLVALIFVKKASFYMNFMFYSRQMMVKLMKFSWPYFVISIFTWAIISLDKFIGAGALNNKDHIAFLALAMQITIPIAILSDMIRMSIGPFIMSIRKDKDADESYQRIFDLSVYSGFGVLMLILFCAPYLIEILSNETFLPAIRVIPLIAMGSVISIMANQFMISFALVKKNALILIATVAGGIVGATINILFMSNHGFIISGVAQIAAFTSMAIILFLLGKKKTNLNINLKAAISMMIVAGGVILVIYSDMEHILKQNYNLLWTATISGAILLTVVYLTLQKVSIRQLVRALQRKKNG
ncbi:MAG: O-antigen/teichoic acid export membrane protein [Flavobacteriaceae bacterium]